MDEKEVCLCSKNFGPPPPPPKPTEDVRSLFIWVLRALEGGILDNPVCRIFVFYAGLLGPLKAPKGGCKGFLVVSHLQMASKE